MYRRTDGIPLSIPPKQNAVLPVYHVVSTALLSGGKTKASKLSDTIFLSNADNRPVCDIDNIGLLVPSPYYIYLLYHYSTIYPN